MNTSNDIDSGSENSIVPSLGGEHIGASSSKNYGFPTLKDSIIGAEERSKYGLDDIQIQKGLELGLTREKLLEIEKRQIEGKKILEHIHAIPDYIQKILIEIYDSIQQTNGIMKTLPIEINGDILGFIKIILPPYVIKNNYHIGAVLYDVDYESGHRAQKILFLLSLWQKFPEIFGKFHSKTSIRPTSQLPYGYHPFLISRLSIKEQFTGYYKYAPDIVNSKSMEKYSDIYTHSYNFSFLGYDDSLNLRKNKDRFISWLEETLVIGGISVTHGRLRNPSLQKLWQVFLTSIIHKYVQSESGIKNTFIGKEILQIHGESFLTEIYTTYATLLEKESAPTELPATPGNNKKYPKRKKPIIQYDRHIDTHIIQHISALGFEGEQLHMLRLSGDSIDTVTLTIGADTYNLGVENNTVDISPILEKNGIEADIQMILTEKDTTSEDILPSVNIVWKSPILEYIKTSIPTLTGTQKYAFERGEITRDFFRALENISKYMDSIGIIIISPEGLQTTENDLPIKNGKYEFRFFLKSNPEITSKSTYYTRNKKESAQVVSRVESKFIEVMDTPQKAPQKIVSPPMGISEVQKSFENTILDALDSQDYTLREMSDTIYELRIGSDITIIYDTVGGHYTLASESDITLSDDICELIYADIIEPYLDTKEMLRKNETLEAKESQIKALKKIRNIYRRELESYNAEDTENPFDTRIDTMMRRDAQGHIIGYPGYSTIAFGKHTETLQALLSKTPGISIDINKEQKSILISFEQGTMRATIRSTKPPPYYEISTHGWSDDTRDMEQIFLDTLRYLYLLTGVMSTGEKKENIYTSREGKNMILDAYKRLEKGEAKIELDSGWYHGGWYESKIEGKKGLDVLTGDDDIRIVLHDESIAVAEKEGKGQKNIYEHIRDNTRLQKYLILRMVATIRDKKIKNKSPFDSKMKDEFLKVWNALSENTKTGFTDIFEHNEEGSTDVALIYEVDGEYFFQKVLNSWEASGVALVYRSPQIIGVDEFQDYIADMREKGELS